MHISALSNHMMLNLSARWLSDADFEKALQDAGPLGVGLLDQLTLSHDQLADIQRRRDTADASLRALITRAGKVDNVHDRKARSVWGHLRALIDGTDDPTLVQTYEELETRLFPHGLRVTKLPYIEEGGAAVALDRAVGVELRAQLATIQVGDQNMLMLFDAWMKAGHEIGEIVSARAKAQHELSRERNEAGVLDIKASRNRWIQAVRALLWAVDIDDKIAAISDRVHAPLERAIASVHRRRAAAGLEDDGSEELGVGEGEDVDPFGDEADGGDELDDDVDDAADGADDEAEHDAADETELAS